MATSGTWRPMRFSDVGTVKAISDAVHGRYTEDEAIYAERLSLHPAGCFLFEDAGRVLGYLVAHPWEADSVPAFNAPLGAIPENPGSYYLHDLALLPDARGSGAGRTALGLIVAQARREGLGEIWLTAVNGADSFWAAQGFEVVEAPDPAGYDETCRRMKLRVSMA
ncbi:GNAT superfamily N-acetyltransferase [Sphingobium sp. B11D3B]|uniref:GNAT family N-acetyltransferase n=1 Tax=Sphingobium sp. B11D3B TaxID=2940575 RepID=UPI0022271848|nr:GNAT family N-acetyltransferase [Sphingobium sp. B11D3B]MCW2388633.1 GNAT superfamily N-acetyltransferase [Sphingobium sp. B11D3B]